MNEFELTSLDKQELESRLIAEAVHNYNVHNTNTTFGDMKGMHGRPVYGPNQGYGGTWVSDRVEFGEPVFTCNTAGGHEVGEIAQYPDGTIVGNCIKCGDRMTLTAVPGGYTPMQIRGFLERVIAGDAESDGELLAELGRLIAVMELEREELELATNRIEIAKTLLTQRSEAKNG